MRSLQPGAQARHSYARTFPPLIYPERTRPSLSSTVDKSSAGYPLRPVVPKPPPDRWLRAAEIYLHDVHGGSARFGNLGSFCLATRLPRRTSPWLETRRAGSTACAQGHRVTAGRRCQAVATPARRGASRAGGRCGLDEVEAIEGPGRSTRGCAAGHGRVHHLGDLMRVLHSRKAGSKELVHSAGADTGKRKTLRSISTPRW